MDNSTDNGPDQGTDAGNAADTAVIDTAVVDVTPDVIDGVAYAKLYGEPLFKLPNDLYIPPDALEVFLEQFE